MTDSKHPDVFYMQRCFELALKGGKHTKSNPMVGCVIVHQDQIIGEGYHKQYGGPHAEVNAINSVLESDASKLAEATIYVSLEPCSFVGKTPACATMLVEKKLKKVIIGCLDPNPKVSGNGIQYLKDHGIEVELSILGVEADELISKFKANLNQRPYIILKWAQSQDGFISKTKEQTWLSNPISKIMAHKWRTEVDGILVGKNTASIDNPQLTAREYPGESPMRIVLDSQLELSNNLHLYSDEQVSITFNTLENKMYKNKEFIKIEDTKNLTSILDILYRKEIYSILVEGGATVLKSFIKSNLWDEARVIKTNKKLYEGISSPNVEGILTKRMVLQDDEVLFIKNKSL